MNTNLPEGSPRRCAFAKPLCGLLTIIVAGLCASCVPQPRTATKIKVLSLNPDEYIGNRVYLAGRVQGVGPAESYLIIEDDTGRILVGTEQIAHKVGCQQNAKIELAGTLRHLKSVSQPYFSMDSLVDCKP